MPDTNQFIQSQKNKNKKLEILDLIRRGFVFSGREAKMVAQLLQSCSASLSSRNVRFSHDAAQMSIGHL